MPVFFTDLSGNTRKLMPTPFVSVSKEYQKAGDGEMLGCTYNISLTGTIVAHKGSPQSDGGWITTDVNESIALADNKHKSVLNKIKAISNLFSSDNNGGLLAVDFTDGTDGFSAHVEIESVDFSEGNNLVQKTGYAIGLKAYVLYGPNGQTDDSEEFPYHIQSAEESWDITETDEQTLTMDALVGVSDVKKVYQITHSMSATGKTKWDDTVDWGRLEQVQGGEAWQQALLYLMHKMGSPLGVVGGVAGGYATEQDFDNPVITDIIGIYGMNIPAGVGYQGFDYGRTQTIDKKGGSVSVTETWLLAASSAGVIETFDISICDADGTSSGESGTNTITLSGTIRGLARADLENTYTHMAETDAQETKYTNAKAAFLARLPLFDDLAKITANTYLCTGCGLYFRSKPDSKQVGVNVQKGEITYSFTYSTKPDGEFGDGVQDASISITDTHPGNVIAVTPVLGRIYGPVIQDMGAVTEYKRSLSINLTMNANDIGLTQLPGVISLEAKMKLIKPSNFNLDRHNFTGVELHPPLPDPDARTIQEQLRDVISAAVPNEAGIIKYRVQGAPNETWDVMKGSYSFKIDWIYEKAGGIFPAAGFTVHPAMSTGFVGGNE